MWSKPVERVAINFKLGKTLMTSLSMFEPTKTEIMSKFLSWGKLSLFNFSLVKNNSAEVS